MAHVAVLRGISKVERAKAMLADALVARAALEAGTALHCPTCKKHVTNYDPPIGRLTFPCGRCGTWIDFSTVRSP